jgi:hypothetical protein
LPVSATKQQGAGYQNPGEFDRQTRRMKSFLMEVDVILPISGWGTHDGT